MTQHQFWKSAKPYRFRGKWMTVADVRKITGWSDNATRARIVGDQIEDRPLVPRSERNASAVKSFLFRGENLTATQIAQRTGRSLSWVYKHVSGSEVIEHDHLPRDIQINSTPIYFAGESLVPYQWAKRLGIDSSTLYRRIDAGWTVERALTERPRPARQRALYHRNRRVIRRLIAGFRASHPTEASHA